jgi:hypothetical protein
LLSHNLTTMDVVVALAAALLSPTYVRHGSSYWSNGQHLLQMPRIVSRIFRFQARCLNARFRPSGGLEPSGDLQTLRISLSRTARSADPDLIRYVGSPV